MATNAVVNAHHWPVVLPGLHYTAVGLAWSKSLTGATGSESVADAVAEETRAASCGLGTMSTTLAGGPSAAAACARLRMSTYAAAATSAMNTAEPTTPPAIAGVGGAGADAAFELTTTGSASTVRLMVAEGGGHAEDTLNAAQADWAVLAKTPSSTLGCANERSSELATALALLLATSAKTVS